MGGTDTERQEKEVRAFIFPIPFFTGRGPEEGIFLY
jgi:hypothetical protein